MFNLVLTLSSVVTRFGFICIFERFAFEKIGWRSGGGGRFPCSNLGGFGTLKIVGTAFQINLFFF